MNCVKIKGSKLSGRITVPSSKSLCHRSIICASLANASSIIDNVVFSDDIYATCEAMEKLGAKIEKISPNRLKITGTLPKANDGEIIECRESGSTLRFMIPLGLLTGKKLVFTGRGMLVDRPLNSYYRIFDKQNISYKNDKGSLPLQIEGGLQTGDFEIEGNISSQFITGLMFALPLLKGDSRIVITNRLESKGYVDLTIDVLSEFGIEIINNQYSEFIIKGNQAYKNNNYTVEGDYSQAAFWLVASILGEEIVLDGLNPNSSQGDRAIVDLVKEVGGGKEIDGSQCPDLVPILATLAALTKGETRIVNASRLRIKESDRLKAISTELNKLGADIVELEDGLIIKGKENLNGGVVDSWNDHRIAMSLAIASIKCKEDLIITNSDTVKKSYPNFWKDFKSLGGDVDEFNMGD